MKRLLFIYGFGGSPDSTFCRLLMEALPSDQYEMFCPEYPQEDIARAILFLEDYLKQEKIDLIVGTSLGAFITLCLHTDLPCVVLNPCMMPSVELPKLKKRPDHPEDKEATPMMLEACRRLEPAVNSGFFNTSQHVIGLFGKEDELLGLKYKESFKAHYNNARDMPGGHHGNSEAIPAICQAIKEVTTSSSKINN